MDDSRPAPRRSTPGRFADEDQKPTARSRRSTGAARDEKPSARGRFTRQEKPGTEKARPAGVGKRFGNSAKAREDERTDSRFPRERSGKAEGLRPRRSEPNHENPRRVASRGKEEKKTFRGKPDRTPNYDF